MTDPHDGEVYSGVIGSWVLSWLRAVRLQASRAADAQILDDRFDAEAHMYIGALRDLLRACLMAAHLPAAQHAVDRFVAEVPGLKDARDMLEHFDDYESGRGRLQHRAGAQEAGLLLFYESDGSTKRVHVGDLVLDIGASSEAAERLAADVMEALNP